MKSRLSLCALSLLSKGVDFEVIRLEQFMSKFSSVGIDLAPSLILGERWDALGAEDWPTILSDIREKFVNRINSLQSLTYGLNISLGCDLTASEEFGRRLSALKVFSDLVSSECLMLGSPAHRTIPRGADRKKSQYQFEENIMYMSDCLGSHIRINIENNTVAQGAEFCSTLSEVVGLVKRLRANGYVNVGLNLDLPSLKQELSGNFLLPALISPDIVELIGSVQVGSDFLLDNSTTAAVNRAFIGQMMENRGFFLSLEEFGIEIDTLNSFFGAGEYFVKDYKSFNPESV